VDDQEQQRGTERRRVRGCGGERQKEKGPGPVSASTRLSLLSFRTRRPRASPSPLSPLPLAFVPEDVTLPVLAGFPSCTRSNDEQRVRHRASEQQHAARRSRPFATRHARHAVRIAYRELAPSPETAPAHHYVGPQLLVALSHGSLSRLERLSTRRTFHVLLSISTRTPMLLLESNVF
jgi:hypothetical protein